MEMQQHPIFLFKIIPKGLLNCPLSTWVHPIKQEFTRLRFYADRLKVNYHVISFFFEAQAAVPVFHRNSIRAQSFTGPPFTE